VRDQKLLDFLQKSLRNNLCPLLGGPTHSYTTERILEVVRITLRSYVNRGIIHRYIMGPSLVANDNGYHSMIAVHVKIQPDITISYLDLQFVIADGVLVHKRPPQPYQLELFEEDDICGRSQRRR
jgi:hypothetical protein